MDHAPTPAAPPSPWTQLIRTLVPQTMDAFEARFGREIHIDVTVGRNAEGAPTPVFKMAMAKPGLLPTAIERAWFEAYVAGYRQCCNIVLDMFDATANGQVVS